VSGKGAAMPKFQRQTRQQSRAQANRRKRKKNEEQTSLYARANDQNTNTRAQPRSAQRHAKLRHAKLTTASKKTRLGALEPWTAASGRGVVATPAKKGCCTGNTRSSI